MESVEDIKIPESGVPVMDSMEMGIIVIIVIGELDSPVMVGPLLMGESALVDGIIKWHNYFIVNILY